MNLFSPFISLKSRGVSYDDGIFPLQPETCLVLLLLSIHTQVTGGDASPREGRSGRSFPLCLTDVSQHRCTLLSYRRGAGEERN